LKKKKFRIEIAVISMIIGIMVIMQIRSIEGIGGLVSTQRADDLLVELNQLTRENQQLITRANELEDIVNEFESEAAENNQYIERLVREAEEARRTAGFTDVEGEGLVVTLDYEQRDEEDSFDPFLYNSELLLLLINELNAAGAEAISINGERIINTSEIRLAGNHININGQKHSRPFEFKVIGNKQTLRSAILIRAGIVEVMRNNYIEVNIEDQDEILIEAYDGSVSFEYAQPVEEE